MPDYDNGLLQYPPANGRTDGCSFFSLVFRSGLGHKPSNKFQLTTKSLQSARVQACSTGRNYLVKMADALSQETRFMNGVP